MNIVIHAPKDCAILKTGVGILKERLELVRSVRAAPELVPTAEDPLTYEIKPRRSDSEETRELESMIWQIERLVDDMDAVIEDFEEMVKKNKAGV